MGVFKVLRNICLGLILLWTLNTTVFASGYVQIINQDTMALVVSTGVSDGSCIGFFGVEYEDTNGNVHTHYIFPYDGDYEKSALLAAQMGVTLNTSRQRELQELGYVYEEWSETVKNEALTSYSEDVFLFKPEYSVAEVKNIYIYTDVMSGSGKTWSCTGMAVYSVEKFHGMEMYGYASEQTFTSFEGKLMARMEGSSKNFSTSTDTIYKVSPDSVQFPLDTTILDTEDYVKSANSEYIFKIDIADVYGAGIEAFTNNEVAGLKKMELPEVLSLQIIYTCTEGRKQKVEIPVITSAIAYASNYCKSSTELVDFAGQGESIVTVGNLPYFKELESVKLTYGSESAKKDCGIVETGLSEGRTARINRINNSNDTISISGISIYKSGEGASSVSYDVLNDTILVPTISGSPLYYFTADTYRGTEIGVEKTMNFTMKPYVQGARLEPVDNQKKYLVVIETDSVSTSTSRRIIPDITMQLSYESTGGYEAETEVYRLKELAKEYYGYTPNMSNEDCSYSMNVYTGEKLFVLVSLSDVEKFTAVTFGLTNQFEEWQLSNFAIYKVEELSKRQAQWIKGGKDFFGQSAQFEYYRELNGTPEPLSKTAEVYNAPINVFVQNAEKQTIDFSSLNVVETDVSFDWMAENKYELEYKKASTSYLGFYKAKVDYQVDVKVADNSTNAVEDGDSGSKNFFYFQLIFENGTSGIVQANQLLEADGFLTGQTATFNISTNYDYGELLSVRVIPDDFSSKADPYDKLNVDYINVTKKAKSGYASVWNVADVGWIGIDYKDEGNATGTSTDKSRPMEELAYVYNVTGSSAGVELQFAITTGAYPEESNGKQFVGSVTADVGYLDANGGYKTISFDVVSAMYSYANKTAEYTAGNGKRQSDSSYMFLENRTNRFTYFINDISELVDIRLYVYSDGGGVLNISSISAALVVEEGPLSINNWGEYEKDSTLFPLSRNANPISVFYVGKGDSVNANIAFRVAESGMLSGLVNGTWPYTVNPELSINEDYLKIFVYPENTLTTAPDVTLRASLDYSDSYGQGYRVQKALNYLLTESGTGYYSAEAVRASDLEAIKEVKIEKISGRGDVALGTVIIQKIRDGQIIQTSRYDMGGINASVAPSETMAMTPEDTGERQIVTLAFAQDMIEKQIEAGSVDVAVALIYTSTYDPSGKEYVSPYVYMSANDKDTISGGEFGEFVFSVSNVDKITGISVAATGGLSIKVENAAVASYKASNGVLKIQDWYSIREGAEITNGSVNLNVTTKEVNSLNTLIPIQIAIKTGMESGHNTGTDAAIRMVMRYVGFDDNSYVIEIPNIRKYTVSGGYSTNSEAVVQMMLPNIKEISSISFEPYDNLDSNTESWKLGEVALNYGVEGAEKKAQIALTDESAFAYEGAPVRVVLKKVVVKLHYKEGETVKTIQNASAGCIIETGEALSVWAAVENSSSSSQIKVYEVIDDSRRDVTEKYLSNVANSGEKIFLVPTGAIDSDTTFEIVAQSLELPEYESVLKVVVKALEVIEPETEASTDATAAKTLITVKAAIAKMPTMEKTVTIAKMPTVILLHRQQEIILKGR